MNAAAEIIKTFPEWKQQVAKDMGMSRQYADFIKSHTDENGIFNINFNDYRKINTKARVVGHIEGIE